MEDSQITFIFAIIHEAARDYWQSCCFHEKIENCEVCKNQLSAVLFFQSDLYLKLLEMIGINSWIHPLKLRAAIKHWNEVMSRLKGRS